MSIHHMPYSYITRLYPNSASPNPYKIPPKLYLGSETEVVNLRIPQKANLEFRAQVLYFRNHIVEYLSRASWGNLRSRR